MVEIELPLCASAAGVELDVETRAIKLSATAPGGQLLYSLEARLPYDVDGAASAAKFDRATHYYLALAASLRRTISKKWPRPSLSQEKGPLWESAASPVVGKRWSLFASLQRQAKLEC